MQPMARRNKAGRSSIEKFRQERRANMREQWLTLSVGVLLTLALVAWVIFGEGWGRIFAAFMLGVCVTGLGFAWMLGFDAHSLRWTWGAVGEQWTAEELTKLESDWHSFHDIPNDKGNWDHVVVGRPGVFVIDSKFLSEPATVDSQGLRSGRLRAGGGASRGGAARMSAVIERETGLSLWVQGVVAVWGQLPLGVIERDKVLYVPAAQLVETLRDRPPRLTTDQCARVKTVLAALASG
jgi:Nuclease-related domain